MLSGLDGHMRWRCDKCLMQGTFLYDEDEAMANTIEIIRNDHARKSPGCGHDVMVCMPCRAYRMAGTKCEAANG